MQSTCYNLVVSDPTSSKGLWAVKLSRELWKRQIWTDAKAVSILEAAALSQSAKVVTSGVRFFLGGDQEREEAADEDSEEQQWVECHPLDEDWANQGSHTAHRLQQPH